MKEKREKKTLHICLILIFLAFPSFGSPFFYDDVEKTFIDFYNGTKTSFINETFYNYNNTKMPENSTNDEKARIIIELKKEESPESLIAFLAGIKAENTTEHWIINAISVKVATKYVEDIIKRPEVEKVWRDEKVHAYPSKEIGSW